MPEQSQRLVLKPRSPQRIFISNVTTAVSLKANLFDRRANL